MKISPILALKNSVTPNTGGLPQDKYLHKRAPTLTIDLNLQ